MRPTPQPEGEGGDRTFTIAPAPPDATADYLEAAMRDAVERSAAGSSTRRGRGTMTKRKVEPNIYDRDGRFFVEPMASSSRAARAQAGLAERLGARPIARSGR